MCQGYTKRPFSERAKANTIPCPRGNTRRVGDTTTLHTLLPEAACEGRVSTTVLGSCHLLTLTLRRSTGWR